MTVKNTTERIGIGKKTLTSKSKTCIIHSMKNRKAQQIRLIQDVARFVLNRYNLDPFVDVELCKFSDSDDLAFVRKDDDDLFVIEVNKQFLATATTAELVTTICHEAVHIKQHILDGLSSDSEVWYYRGEVFVDDNYWFFPWEVEARGMQDAFAWEYLKENNYEHEVAA